MTFSKIFTFLVFTFFFLISLEFAYSQAPAAPSDLNATTVSATKISLTWVDNSTNEYGFKIEKKSSYHNDTAFRPAGIAPHNATAFMSSHLRPNTMYYFRVRAFNISGISQPSNIDSALTNNDTNFVIPNAPSDLTATALSPRSINLVWSDNSNNERKFIIERRSVNGHDSVFHPVGITHRNDTTFRAMGLMPDTEYDFRVAAVNQAGHSDYSNIATARTLPDSIFHIIPNAPTNLDAVLISGNRVKLTWTDNSHNERGFGIELRKANDTAFRRVGMVSSNHTTFTVRRLHSNTLYYFRVFAFNMGGHSDYSNIDTATTHSGNSVANENEVSDGPEVLSGEFKLYSNFPNPFNPTTKIAFEIPNSGLVSMKIFDMLGKEVTTLVNEYMEAGYYETNFNASDLSSGMYFYKLTSDNKSDIKKMILMK